MTKTAQYVRQIPYYTISSNEGYKSINNKFTATGSLLLSYFKPYILEIRCELVKRRIKQHKNEAVRLINCCRQLYNVFFLQLTYLIAVLLTHAQVALLFVLHIVNVVGALILYNA